jgi:site-specific recombinase XerD
MPEIEISIPHAKQEERISTKENGAVYLFESNRMQKYTTRWIREIVKKYAKKAGTLS